MGAPVQDGLAYDETSCEENQWRVGVPWVGFCMREMNGGQFANGKTDCG
jgi:hypothetical protein